MDPQVGEYLQCELRVKHWIEQVLSEEIEDDLSVSLKSGIVLCHVLLKLDSSSIPSVQYGEDNAAYKLRENVEFFIQGMEEYGVEQSFHPADLLLKRNMFRVLYSLIELATIAERNGFPAKLLPQEEIQVPELLSLSETHRKTVLLSKSRSVAPRFRRQRTKLLIESLKLPKVNISAPRPEPTPRDTRAVIKFQAVVRGFLVRKHLAVKRRHNAYRSSVAKEILTTEKRYVESLKICITKFLTPLQNVATSPRKSRKPTDESIPVLQNTTVRAIFSDIKMIYSFHLHSVLNVIQPRVDSWNIYQCVGDIFIKITSMMKIYSQYIMNYSNSTNTTIELQQDAQFSKWKQSVEQELGGIGLSSFLIMPVQRVPRYIMLLRDLYKHTWPDHPDYSNLKEAAEEMEKLTLFLDSKKKESENLNRLVSLAGQFKGKIDINLVEPHRKFIREDRFGNNTVHLFNDLLIISKETNEKRNCRRVSLKKTLDSTPTLKYSCHYLNQLEVVETANGFQIRLLGVHTILLACEVSPSISFNWLEDFTKFRESSDPTPYEDLQMRDDLNCGSLQREDSLKKLHKSYYILQNHMNSLDEQMKSVKHKREKKELEVLKQSFVEKLKEIDNSISVKINTRKTSARERLPGRTRATSVGTDEFSLRPCTTSFRRCSTGN